MFGISILAMAKEDLLKYKDKSGNPIAIDALNDIENSLVVINNFVSKFTPADIQTILALLPSSVAAKFLPAEITEFSNAIVNLPVEIQEAEALITEAKTELE